MKVTIKQLREAATTIGLGLLFSAVVMLAVFGLLNALVNAPPVHAQSATFIPGVHTMQITIGAGVTRISSTSVPVIQVMFQNNQTHSMRVGDSLTTSSRGALLASGSPGGSVNSSGFGINAASDLNQWFVAGTQNDVIDVLYIQ